MHGGRRNKFTHWLSCNPRALEVDLFQSLHLLCDQQHSHASWAPYIDDSGRQIFPTASEAAYPELLCTRIACILKAEALKQVFLFPSTWRTNWKQILILPKDKSSRHSLEGSAYGLWYQNFKHTNRFFFHSTLKQPYNSSCNSCRRDPEFAIELSLKGFFSGMTN